MKLCKSSTVIIETSGPVNGSSRIFSQGIEVSRYLAKNYYCNGSSRSRASVSLLQLEVEAVGHDPEVEVDQELDYMDHCNDDASVVDRCHFVLSGCAQI